MGIDPILAGARTSRAFRYTSRPMQKQAWTWTTAHFPQPARMVRWGHFGTPVLIFPTAGGDFEEIERFSLVSALCSLIDGGGIKVYSVDALAVRARLSGATSIDEGYDSFLYEDVLRRIRSDCQDERIEPLLVGASLGAGTAMRTLCRHPDAFRGAIGMSGFYGDWEGWFSASGNTMTAGRAGGTASARIEQLKGRAITLGTGSGAYENPTESKRLAEALAAKGIPCRFSDWGAARDHAWSTWRDLLPGLL